MVKVLDQKKHRSAEHEAQLSDQLVALFDELRGLGEISGCVKVKIAALAALVATADRPHRDLIEAGLKAAREGYEQRLAEAFEAALAANA